MSHTLYARYTDKDNNVHVNRHQVWDQDRFVAARSKDAAEENARQKDPALRNHSFTVISEAEYKAAK